MELSEEAVTDLVTRYDGGEGIQSLRKATGLGHHTIKALLVARGVKIRDQQEAEQARSARVVRLRVEARTAATIARARSRRGTPETA